jgi:cytidylate kinase
VIIAIDGPAGSGKSTVAKRVAQMLGFHYLDTGAMYRCIAWYALEHGIDLDDAATLEKVTREQTIAFAHQPGSPLASGVSIAGVDVTAAIRTPQIDKAVSPVSALPAVREALVKQQRAIASAEDIVMEGRDIGTVVFPHAELKVFLTASAEERARRRAAQNSERGYGEMDVSAILEAIIARDKADSTRAVSPLKPADDAVMLDTTDMSIDQVCAAIARLAEERR